MKTIQFTDEEFAVIRQAMITHNDIQNDTICDRVTSVNLYPKDLFPDEKISVLTPKVAKELREEMTEMMMEYAALRSVLNKLGLEVGENGYTK